MTEREVFEAAVDLSPDYRAGFLDGACGSDTPFRQRLGALLTQHERAGGFLEKPALTGTCELNASPTDVGPSAVCAGQVLVGRYTLLEQIGEGGMGAVWLAQQTAPVRRHVAVKVIKPGLDSRAIPARFEAERQALALMDHPNIAKVFDGGAMSDGRPFFVMELVQGMPITRYCDDHKLTLRQRLELFVPVCHAVQHAHQKGIIHRDVKPSNVLVAVSDDLPVPKVIDFGVAKATGPQLSEQTLHTGYGAVVGSIEYMSPEQAAINPLDVDTRSDIYSLGVVLHELLTGGPPFTCRLQGPPDWLETLRLIREQEPIAPSAKLRRLEALPALAANRGTEPARLPALVRGELDWIVLKALEKDRNRRYQTANELARDIQRYLADEPVLAGPPRTGYRFRKFVQRHKAGVAIAALSLVFIVLLGVGGGWFVRDRSARHAKLAGQLELILAELTDLEAEQKWTEALATARRAEVLLAGSDGDAELERQVREILAELKLVQRMEEVRQERDRVSPGKSGVAMADAAYAAVLRDLGFDLNVLVEKAEADQLRARVPLAAALDDWAYCRLRMKNNAGGQALRSAALRIDPDPRRRQVREAVARRDVEALKALAADPATVFQPPATLFMLARVLRQSEKHEETIAMLRHAQRQHPSDFWINFELGSALDSLPAHRADALSSFRAAAALRPQSAWAWSGLGKAFVARGELDEAIPCFWKAVELAPNHWAAGHLFNAIRSQKDRTPTIAFFNKAIEASPRNALAYWYFGNALLYQGRIEVSLAPFRRASELDPLDPRHHHSVGFTLATLNRLDEAIGSYKQAIKCGSKDPELYYVLGVALNRKGQFAESVDAWKTALIIAPNYMTAHTALAWNLATASDPRLRDPEVAVAHARKAVAVDQADANNWSNLGVALWRAGDIKAAVETLEKADQMLSAGDLHHRFFLAMAYWQIGEKEKARQAYEQGVQWMDKNQPGNEELRRFRAETEELMKKEPNVRNQEAEKGPD